MAFYNTFSEFASAAEAWMPGELVEELYGKHAAKAGNVRQNGSGYMILDGGWRKATDLENAGIERQIERFAEALAAFGCDPDDAAADYWDARSDDRIDWDGYADTVCTCKPNDVMACPACLDRIDATYGEEIPYC